MRMGVVSQFKDLLCITVLKVVFGLIHWTAISKLIHHYDNGSDWMILKMGHLQKEIRGPVFEAPKILKPHELPGISGHFLKRPSLGGRMKKVQFGE